MPSTSWKTFISSRENRIFFTAVVSSTLGKGARHDRKRKPLPTPYALFQEWASANLTDEWASVKVKGLLIVGVATAADAALIRTKFGVVGPTKLRIGSSVVHQLKFDDRGYVPLARQLGYSL